MRISSCVIDQGLIFEDGQQLDFEYAALELAKNTDIPDEKPATTLAANVISQIPPQQLVLVLVGRSQTEVSLWVKAYKSLSAAPIQLRHGSPNGGGNLSAAVANNPAATTKRYRSQPSLKLPTPPKRQALPAVKDDSQIWTDIAGCQDNLGKFYHRNREKVDSYPSF